MTPAELGSGTLTLNNYGVFGVDDSAAIINFPEAAILGVDRITDKPWVVKGELAVRKVTELTLTFDDRVCHGGTAAGFLRYVAVCIGRHRGTWFHSYGHVRVRSLCLPQHSPLGDEASCFLARVLLPECILLVPTVRRFNAAKWRRQRVPLVVLEAMTMHSGHFGSASWAEITGLDTSVSEGSRVFHLLSNGAGLEYR